MGLCSLLGLYFRSGFSLYEVGVSFLVFVGSGSLFLALGSLFEAVQGLSPIIGLRACFIGLIGSG